MKRQQRINFLFLILLFTALLLTVTTYAWFTTNRIFEIDSFDIQVATKGGLEISTDGIDFKGVVGMLDLVEANNTYPSNINQIPNSIKPVSSGGEIENGFLRMYYGEVEQGSHTQILYAKRNIEERGFSESKGNFIAFDIFFRTTFRRRVTISPNSGVSLETGTSGMENAFRIAFLNQGSGETSNQVQNLRNANRSYIWETNYDVHTENAINHAKDIYGIDTTLYNANRIEYSGIINDISRSLNIEVKDAKQSVYPNLFKMVNVDVATKKNEIENKLLFDIERGITKVRIYIWLEGQDIDCENNSSVGSVIINIQFDADPI